MGTYLRDIFAAAALQGLLAAEASADNGGAVNRRGDALFTPAGFFARIAYELADAMLAARNIHGD